MPECCVEGCAEEATAEVILYDVYTSGEVFFERDNTCSFLCTAHLIENERKAAGERKPRGHVNYPFTNRHGAQGFTIYRPLVGDA